MESRIQSIVRTSSKLQGSDAKLVCAFARQTLFGQPVHSSPAFAMTLKCFVDRLDLRVPFLMASVSKPTMDMWVNVQHVANALAPTPHA